MKNIDYRFKILYALAMLFVVCGHCHLLENPLTLNGLFPFAGIHLALFIFASGYFYNPIVEELPLQFILKKLKTLILPLFIYNIVYGFVVMGLKKLGFNMGADLSLFSVFIQPITDGHQFIYNMGGWFIIPLFLVQVFTVLGRKLCKTIVCKMPEWGYFVIALILGIAGNELAVLGYNTNWMVPVIRLAYFIPFFALGIFYRSTLEKYESKISVFVLMIASCFFKYCLNGYYGKTLAYVPAWGDDYTEGAVIPIVVGFLGIVFWLEISRFLLPFIGKSKVVNAIANNTYSIMMNQFLGFMLMKWIFYLISIKKAGWPAFDMAAFKTDIWYFYDPGKGFLKYLYIVAAIVVPIAIQRIINLVNKLCSTSRVERKL